MDRLEYLACLPVYKAIKFEPTGPEQREPLEALDRFPVIAGGERAGKSIVAEKILLPHVIALPHKRPERFYKNGKIAFNPKTDAPKNPDFTIFGPTYAQPRIEFQYLEDDLRTLGMVHNTSKPTDGPWRLVTTDGVVVTTFSLELPDAVRAIDLEGALIVEAGWCPYGGVERVQGRVSTKRGFIVYSGTIENSQRWYTDWLLEGRRPNGKGIVSYSIPTWTNRIWFPGGRDDPEIKRLEAFYGADTFAERCAAEPRPPRYRVVSEASEAHIRHCDYPDTAEIKIAVDPGWATAHAVLFIARWQEKDAGERFHIFHEFYEQKVDVRGMVELCRTVPAFHKVRKGVIDVSAATHKDASQSALEIWNNLTSIDFDRKMHPEDRSIERLNASFRAVGSLTIDPSCVGIIAELGLGEPVFPEMHPWRYNTDRDGRVLGEKPKDAWNHSCKALAYYLLNEIGQVERKHRPTNFNRMRWRGNARNTEPGRRSRYPNESYR